MSCVLHQIASGSVFLAASCSLLNRAGWRRFYHAKNGILVCDSRKGFKRLLGSERKSKATALHSLDKCPEHWRAFLRWHFSNRYTLRALPLGQHTPSRCTNILHPVGPGDACDQPALSLVVQW